MFLAAAVSALALVAAGHFALRVFSSASLASFSKQTTFDNMCRDKVDRPCDLVDVPPM